MVIDVRMAIRLNTSLPIGFDFTGTGFTQIAGWYYLNQLLMTAS
jgi:hypothetical protein